MSLQAEKKRFRNEMKAGVYLASIFDIKLHKDSNTKQPIVKDGEMALIVTFVTTTKDKENLYHDQIYWIGKGKDGREKYFTQMCLDAMIDMSVTPMDVKKARNKRLWIAVREVFTLVNNGEDVKKDIFGKEIIENFIFQTAPIFDVDRVPTWNGDPAKNDGIAGDEFVGYKDDDEDGYVTMPQQGEAMEAPFKLVAEVAPMTKEVEDAVVVEKKPKKEKKVKSVALTDGMVVTNKEELKTIETVFASTLSSTPVPNFGDITPTITPSFDNDTIQLTEEEMEDIANVDNMLHEGRQQLLDDMNETILQDNMDQTAMPNFGDNETPDTNF
jgi:hypothetical protein